MPVLDAKSLCKTYGDRVLLDHVDVTIRRGERVGVVGDNGAGKTTLGKLLAGVTEPDLGTVSRRRGARVEYLAQEPCLPSGQSARHVALSGLSEWLTANEVYAAICAQLAEGSGDLDALMTAQAEATETIEKLGGWDRATEAERILLTLGIADPEQDVGTMSGGEKRRVALARLLIAQPDLAILDEPTNHLDAVTIEWLEKFLTERFPGSLVLITHDRFLLNNVAQRTLEVTGGQVHSYDGGWEEFLMAREERRAVEDRTESNRQNFLRKELEWLRRQPKARTGKQKARIGRAEGALEAEPVRRATALSLDLAETRLGGTILEARQLAVEVPGKRLLTGLDFHLGRGSRVGILGRSGAGKTSLLRTLLGVLPPGAGEVIVGKNTKIVYLDQMRGGLEDDETVYDAITRGNSTVTIGETTLSSYSYLERFRFRGDAVRQKVGGLSGGERARVALAKMLLEPANVLVLDEPTNDLDVMTLGALEDLLLDMTGAALIVSHDRYFLDRVATSVLALDGQGGVEEIQGGYSAFAERRQQLERQARAQPSKPSPEKKSEAPKPAAVSKAKKSLTYAEDLEFKDLLPRTERAASEVKRLEVLLADPELYVARRAAVEPLQAELSRAQAEVARLEERWFVLEEKRGG